MRIMWSEGAWEDYLHWQSQNKMALKWINCLLQALVRTGCECICKPEALKGDLSGFWSVRIDDKNRIVFRKNADVLEIWQCGSWFRDA